MKALVTGASSGIGRDIAIKLSNMGYDVILVSKDNRKLKEASKLCKGNVTTYQTDLSVIDNCKELFNNFKDIDILVNNAGFGLFGEFSNISLDKELNMVDLNVKAVHTLTKLYLKEMIKKDNGRILNVASIAGFLPGPLMATYYSSKAYVMRLTTAIYEELRKNKSNVKVSVLCPGPVDTNFNNVAGVKFSLKSLTSTYVASYAIDKMFKNKLIIVPGFMNKVGIVIRRIIPIKYLLKIAYNAQSKKEG